MAVHDCLTRLQEKFKRLSPESRAIYEKKTNTAGAKPAKGSSSAGTASGAKSSGADSSRSRKGSRDRPDKGARKQHITPKSKSESHSKPSPTPRSEKKSAPTAAKAKKTTTAGSKVADGAASDSSESDEDDDALIKVPTKKEKLTGKTSPRKTVKVPRPSKPLKPTDPLDLFGLSDKAIQLKDTEDGWSDLSKAEQKAKLNEWYDELGAMERVAFVEQAEQQDERRAETIKANAKKSKQRAISDFAVRNEKTEKSFPPRKKLTKV